MRGHKKIKLIKEKEKIIEFPNLLLKVKNKNIIQNIKLIQIK
jgi:hypothetical protein